MVERDPWEAQDRPVSYRTEGEGGEKHRHSPELDDVDGDRGNTLGGILGALLGALVGAIPWFLASTFGDFFIGWLGFLIALASCWGYKKLRGKRSTVFAIVTILICSVFALFAAEFCSWMYVLCTDPEWQYEAEWFDMSVVQYVFETLIMPENLRIIFKNAWVGLLMGAVGAVSMRPLIVEYTDPEKGARAGL